MENLFCFRPKSETGELSYCHPVSSSGAELYYGGYSTDLDKGNKTVFFGQENWAQRTTHIIDDRAFAERPCWVWGVDTSYCSDYEKTCIEM